MHYVAFVHTDDAPGFGVSFPDFPGRVTQGDSLDEALRMAREALAFHVEGMFADGQAVREPSDVQQIESDPDLAEWREGATLAFVPLNPRSGFPQAGQCIDRTKTAEGHRRRRKGARDEPLRISRERRTKGSRGKLVGEPPSLTTPGDPDVIR